MRLVLRAGIIKKEFCELYDVDLYCFSELISLRLDKKDENIVVKL